MGDRGANQDVCPLTTSLSSLSPREATVNYVNTVCPPCTVPMQRYMDELWPNVCINLVLETRQSHIK